MPKVSAGLLMYRATDHGLEVLLAHPGGPFWRDRDVGAWTIPKGELGADEDPVLGARREFEEETGITVMGPLLELGSVRQRGGKVVHAWAFEADRDPPQLCSNTFAMEWPPGSGQTTAFPEIDRARFFTLEEAAEKINPAQAVFLRRLRDHFRSG